MSNKKIKPIDVSLSADSPDTKKGIIFYTDGSARPNPGNTGWGAHGYMYDDVPPTKGSGNPTHTLTVCGYIPKTEKSKEGFREVRPLFYFDCFGSSDIMNSNNVAEVEAITNAITKSLEYNIEDLTIYTDSQYAQRGIEEWRFIWIKKNWMRSDGTPVPNQLYWKKLIAVLDKIEERKIRLSIHWVKGHNEILGNTLADKLSVLGTMHSIARVMKNEFKTTAPDGYWKTDVERHPFISSKKMFFNTVRESCLPGEYYLGEYKGDESDVGRKSGDSSYLVVQLEKPDEVIESVRNYQLELSNDIDMLMLLRLDKLYTPSVYHDVLDYGSMGTVKANGYSSDLNALDAKPLSSELKPPMLALRAVDSLSQLKVILELFKESNGHEIFGKRYSQRDITSSFYTVTEKKNKDTTLKLKPEIGIGNKFITYDFNENIKIDIIFGSDCLSRNALKKLEDKKVSIYLITWKESEQTMRYVTIAKTDNDYGIWGAVYSNLLFLK